MVYYGDDISYPSVGIHDFIIIDPDHTNPYTSGFKTYKEHIYAYVSINEMQKSRSFAKDIDPNWVIGDNPAWGSMLLNITDKAYQDFLLEQVIGKLYKKGFKNFFFDTLDSYQLAKVTKEEKTYLRNGVIQFIQRFKQKFPKAKLITNRGFEMIDYIAPYLEAMLFESYYYGFNATSDKYKEVSDADRVWLDAQLEKVKAKHIPIIALDYLPSHTHQERKNAVKALEEKGFIPYIAEKSLMRYGISSKNAFKREVLIIYNGENLDEDSIISTNAHIYASTPLEYLGYVPVLKDVNAPLPRHVEERYAGIVLWLEKPSPDNDRLLKWVQAAISKGVKVLFAGEEGLPLEHPIVKELGIQTVKNRAPKADKNKIIQQSDIMGFEIKPVIGYYQDLIHLAVKAEPFLSYQNSQEQTSVIAAKTAWGGFVQDNALMSNYINEDTLWVINPFALFKETLRLKPLPIPDSSTENGKRLSFVHIDGDGSMNRVEENPKRFSIEIILEDFIKKYHFPQSISLVESETSPHGKYPKLSARLEKAAKEIYKLPYVEGATHTFTHPYFWKKLEADPSNEAYRTHWDIDYSFTPKREISDSLDYINNLMPKNKTKAHTVFWTGDCLPTEKTLAYTYKHDIININGGDTIITNDRPWLNLILPLALKVGDYYQVYTGQQNENVYTNNWQGPFWGFKKVIQTFKLTNKPRRLKPIDIYYHFYSGSKNASHEALTEVYDWVLAQDVMHIFTSQYPPKVLNFYDCSLAQDANQWLLKGFKDLRTVRVNDNLGVPSIKQSLGVLGYKKEKGYAYVHLDDRETKFLFLTHTPSQETRLISANARVLSHQGDTIHFQGHMPITLRYHIKKGCYLSTSPKSHQQKVGSETIIKFKDEKDVYVTQRCH